MLRKTAVVSILACAFLARAAGPAAAATCCPCPAGSFSWDNQQGSPCTAANIGGGGGSNSAGSGGPGLVRPPAQTKPTCGGFGLPACPPSSAAAPAGMSFDEFKKKYGITDDFARLDKLCAKLSGCSVSGVPSDPRERLKYFLKLLQSGSKLSDSDKQKLMAALFPDPRDRTLSPQALAYALLYKMRELGPPPPQSLRERAEAAMKEYEKALADAKKDPKLQAHADALKKYKEHLEKLADAADRLQDAAARGAAATAAVQKAQAALDGATNPEQRKKAREELSSALRDDAKATKDAAVARRDTDKENAKDAREYADALNKKAEKLPESPEKAALKKAAEIADANAGAAERQRDASDAKVKAADKQKDAAESKIARMNSKDALAVDAKNDNLAKKKEERAGLAEKLRDARLEPGADESDPKIKSLVQQITDRDRAIKTLEKDRDLAVAKERISPEAKREAEARSEVASANREVATADLNARKADKAAAEKELAYAATPAERETAKARVDAADRAVSEGNIAQKQAEAAEDRAKAANFQNESAAKSLEASQSRDRARELRERAEEKPPPTDRTKLLEDAGKLEAAATKLEREARAADKAADPLLKAAEAATTEAQTASAALQGGALSLKTGAELEANRNEKPLTNPDRIGKAIAPEMWEKVYEKEAEVGHLKDDWSSKTVADKQAKAERAQAEQDLAAAKAAPPSEQKAAQVAAAEQALDQKVAKEKAADDALQAASTKVAKAEQGETGSPGLSDLTKAAMAASAKDVGVSVDQLSRMRASDATVAPTPVPSPAIDRSSGLKIDPERAEMLQAAVGSYYGDVLAGIAHDGVFDLNKMSGVGKFGMGVVRVDGASLQRLSADYLSGRDSSVVAKDALFLAGEAAVTTANGVLLTGGFWGAPQALVKGAMYLQVAGDGALSFSYGMREGKGLGESAKEGLMSAGSGALMFFLPAVGQEAAQDFKIGQTALAQHVIGATAGGAVAGGLSYHEDQDVSKAFAEFTKATLFGLTMSAAHEGAGKLKPAEVPHEVAADWDAALKEQARRNEEVRKGQELAGKTFIESDHAAAIQEDAARHQGKIDRANQALVNAAQDEGLREKAAREQDAAHAEALKIEADKSWVKANIDAANARTIEAAHGAALAEKPARDMDAQHVEAQREDARRTDQAKAGEVDLAQKNAIIEDAYRTPSTKFSVPEAPPPSEAPRPAEARRPEGPAPPPREEAPPPPPNEQARGAAPPQETPAAPAPPEAPNPPPANPPPGSVEPQQQTPAPEPSAPPSRAGQAPGAAAPPERPQRAVPAETARPAPGAPEAREQTAPAQQPPESAAAPAPSPEAAPPKAGGMPEAAKPGPALAALPAALEAGAGAGAAKPGAQGPRPAPRELAPLDPSTERQIDSWIQRINETRAEKGLPPLSREAVLEGKRLVQIMDQAGLPNKPYIDRIFFDSVGPDVPAQGIKLRVADPGPGARESVLQDFLKAIADPRLAGKVDFKVCYAMDAMEGTQAGKFITVYPKDAVAARELATLLDSAYRGKGYQAGLPPEDIPFGDNLVSWRYGEMSGENNGRLRIGDKWVTDNRGSASDNLRQVAGDPALAGQPGMDFWLEQAKGPGRPESEPAAGRAARPPPSGTPPELGPGVKLSPEVAQILTDALRLKGGTEPTLHEALKRWAELHPELKGEDLYHNLQHTLNVAGASYDLARARGLPEAQAGFLAKAGLLHDIDPARTPGTPARVDATLEWLRGPKGQELARQFGWDSRQVKMAEAIIQRTEFPFDPKIKPEAVARYKEMLKGLTPKEREFVMREGALLSAYADQASWYFDSPRAALDAVKGLVRELDPKFDLLKGTRGFMEGIGSSKGFDIDRAIAKELGAKEPKLPTLQQMLGTETTVGKLNAEQRAALAATKHMFEQIAAGTDPRIALRAAELMLPELKARAAEAAGRAGGDPNLAAKPPPWDAKALEAVGKAADYKARSEAAAESQRAEDARRLREEAINNLRNNDASLSRQEAADIADGKKQTARIQRLQELNPGLSEEAATRLIEERDRWNSQKRSNALEADHFEALGEDAARRQAKIEAANKDLRTDLARDLIKDLSGRELYPGQAEAVQDAHDLFRGKAGKDGAPARVGNYTEDQLHAKVQLLIDAGFTPVEAKALVRNGIAGEGGVEALAEFHRPKFAEFLKSCTDCSFEKYADGQKLKGAVRDGLKDLFTKDGTLKEPDRFLGLALHDLKSPLTVIKGNLDAIQLLADPARPLSPDAVRSLQQASAESSALVDRIIRMGESLAQTNTEASKRIVDRDAVKPAIDALAKRLAEIRERFGDSLNDSQKRLLETAIGNAEWHLPRMLDRFGSLGELHPAAVSPDQLLRDAIRMLEGKAELKGVKLVVKASPDVRVVVDPAVVSDHILANLGTNAIKYGKGKAVTFSVELEGKGAEQRVRILVENDGEIPQDKLAQLRQFRRGERLGAEQGTQEGQGIGLYETKQLVELNGGVIDVDSRDGKTTFSITLKTQEAAQAQAKAKAAGRLGAEIPPEQPPPSRTSGPAVVGEGGDPQIIDAHAKGARDFIAKRCPEPCGPESRNVWFNQFLVKQGIDRGSLLAAGVRAELGLPKEFRLRGSQEPIALGADVSPDGFKSLLAGQFGEAPRSIDLHTLPGGVSGADVFRVTVGGRDAGVFKVFPDAEGARSEARALAYLESLGLDRLAGVAQRGVVDLVIGGKRRSAMLMDYAGRSLTEEIAALPPASEAAARAKAVDALAGKLGRVAEALAEFHNRTRTSDTIPESIKKLPLEYVRERLRRDIPQGDLGQLAAALDSAIAAHLKAKVPQTGAFHDAHTGNVSAGEAGVAVYDVGRLLRSLEHPNSGMTGVFDVGRFYEALDRFGPNLKPGELKALRERFLETYSRESGISQADLGSAIKLQRVNDRLFDYENPKGVSPEQQARSQRVALEAIKGILAPSAPDLGAVSSRGPPAVFAADAAAARAALGGDPAGAKILKVLGGAEGQAALVDIAGGKWVRKYWPASQQEPLRRVQNELFFKQLIAGAESGAFEVVGRGVAMPDGKGGYFYFSEYREGAAKDMQRYERGLSEEQRAKLAALRFVWGLSDMHAANVQFTADARPLLLDFEMAGDVGRLGHNKVFDRSAIQPPTEAAAEMQVLVKQQPYFLKDSPVELTIEPYRKEVRRWQALLEDPAFVRQVSDMMRRANFSEAEVSAYLQNVRSNIANFERNFTPYLDRANQMIRDRRRLP